MPKFLEKKLRAEYGNNPHAIYGTMNKLGAMHGNKETAKGKRMEQQHAKDAKAAPKHAPYSETHSYNWRSRANLKRGRTT